MKIFDFLNKIYLNKTDFEFIFLQLSKNNLCVQNVGLKNTFETIIWATFETLISEKRWFPALNFLNFQKYFNPSAALYQHIFLENNLEYSQAGLWQLINIYCLQQRSFKEQNLEFKHAIRRLAAKLDRELNSNCVEKIKNKNQLSAFYGKDVWFLSALFGVNDWFAFFKDLIVDLNFEKISLHLKNSSHARQYMEMIALDCAFDSSLLFTVCLQFRHCIDLTNTNFNTPFLTVTTKPLSLVFLSITTDKTLCGSAKELDFLKLRPLLQPICLKKTNTTFEIKFSAVYNEVDAADVCLDESKGGKNYIFKVKKNYQVLCVWVFKNVCLDKFKFSLQVCNDQPCLWFCARHSIFKLDLLTGVLETVYTLGAKFDFCQFDQTKLVLRNKALGGRYESIRLAGSNQVVSYVRADKFVVDNSKIPLIDYLIFAKGSRRKKILAIAKNFHVCNYALFYLPNFTHYFVDGNINYFISNKIILVV